MAQGEIMVDMGLVSGWPLYALSGAIMVSGAPLPTLSGYRMAQILNDVPVAYSGGTTNSYASVLSASGAAGVHGSVSLINRGPNPIDYFLGGNDAYGTLTSGNAATAATNIVIGFDLDSITLQSGKSPLTSMEMQVKSTSLNASGLADIRASIIN